MTTPPSRRALRRALVLVATLFAANALPQQAARNPLPDTPGSGRFPAMKEEVLGLSKHVIYRPANFATLGKHKLGVVAWGNGGCSDDGASMRFHLLELASHGYLVIASGRILSGPGAPPASRPTVPPGQLPPPRTDAADLTAAIDWALAENRRKGSAYYGRIDPQQVALSGSSCGGLQALAVAKDPRVKTLVLHNTGIFNTGPVAYSSMSLQKDALRDIHTPVIYPNLRSWASLEPIFARSAVIRSGTWRCREADLAV